MLYNVIYNYAENKSCLRVEMKINAKRNIIIQLCVDLAVVLLATIVGQWISSWAATKTLSITSSTWIWMGVNMALTIGLYFLFGLYAIVFSSVGIVEALKITVANLVLLLLNTIFCAITDRIYGIGYGFVLAYIILLFSGTIFFRFSKRIILAFRHVIKNHKQESLVEPHGTRIMIIGGGQACLMLLREIMNSKKLNYKPICILDDKEYLHGKRIQNVPVVGSIDNVKEFCKRYNIEEIFVAMPSVPNKVRSKIIEKCSECGCKIKVIPGMYQLAHGQVAISKLRPVEIEDLLGRDPVKTDLNEVMGYIQGKVVLVTGGGGSIGSELCRQIASHNPEKLIILDIYENNAYDIEQELKRKYKNLNLLTLIASIRDKNKIEDVFSKYRPEIVFNAAAHKHVPLMESSPNEAVKNNVFGTLNVAKMADKYAVETFVQISTDKAVNPTNIMGATKRICEMIIQTIGKHSKNTKFVAVRFGNVLGSNGSVIPLFRKQILEGGPVTVTHKDIIRYFMTIPEAVSLVLQAGAYAKGGQIFVLDMGEPVKIYDLAEKLIQLSGYEPNVDIEIKCTGLRPGEKLFEERLMEEEGLSKTENGLINIAKPIPLDEENLWATLDKLYKAAYSETDSMKDWVKELVPTYSIDRQESVATTFIRKLTDIEEKAIGQN